MSSKFVFTKVFDQGGLFSALNAAQRWLEEHGYSYSPTCADSPVGILRGEYIIAKWRNLTPAEIAALDGKLLGNVRDGPMTVYLKHQPGMQQECP